MGSCVGPTVGGHACTLNIKGGPGVLPCVREAKLIQPNAKNYQEMTPKSRENTRKTRPKIKKRSKMPLLSSNQINSLPWLYCGFRGMYDAGSGLGYAPMHNGCGAEALQDT